MSINKKEYQKEYQKLYYQRNKEKKLENCVGNYQKYKSTFQEYRDNNEEYYKTYSFNYYHKVYKYRNKQKSTPIIIEENVLISFDPFYDF